MYCLILNGHHLSIALARHNQGLPVPYRHRRPSCFVSSNDYGYDPIFAWILTAQIDDAIWQICFSFRTTEFLIFFEFPSQRVILLECLFAYPLLAALDLDLLLFSIQPWHGIPLAILSSQLKTRLCLRPTVNVDVQLRNRAQSNETSTFSEIWVCLTVLTVLKI